MKEELWKPVVGFEGLYEVSTFGRVKSLDRIVNFRGSKSFRKGKIKSTWLIDDYVYVSLCKNGVQKPYRVNILVANAFIPNPDNKPTCDHINRVRYDNRVENLRWATYSEQNKNKDLSNHKIKLQNKLGKKVQQLTLKGELVAEYSCIIEAERETGIDRRHISKVCRHKPHYNTAGGYKWEFVYLR